MPLPTTGPRKPGPTIPARPKPPLTTPPRKPVPIAAVRKPPPPKPPRKPGPIAAPRKPPPPIAAPRKPPPIAPPRKPPPNHLLGNRRPSRRRGSLPSHRRAFLHHRAGQKPTREETR